MERQKNLFETIGKIEKGKLISDKSVEGICERCGKKTVLRYVWEHNNVMDSICSECAVELSEEGRIAPEHDDYFQVRQAKEAKERMMREMKEKLGDVEVDDETCSAKNSQFLYCKSLSKLFFS